jgi:hypothetical protein
MLDWKKPLKYFLYFLAGLVSLVFLLAVIAALTSDEDLSQSDGPVTGTPAFYGLEFMPNFVGASLRDSIVLLDEEFGFEFSKIRNLDTDENLITNYYDEDTLRGTEGLFVCSQNVAPGADPELFVLEYDLELEVSSSCDGKVADLHMGPSALAFGVWSPLPFKGNCDIDLRSCDETIEVDGIFVRFLEEETWEGYKIAVVRTGLGEIEAELAWIDPTNQWCGFDPPQEEELVSSAKSARDQLLEAGQKIRLVRTETLPDGKWFFHRLSTSGELLDGEVPELSVNEQLVLTGFWTPDADEIYHFSENYYQPIVDRKWVIQDNYLLEDDPLLFAYAMRLTIAANLAFDQPNEILASCISDQQEELSSSSSFANSGGDDDERNRVYSNSSDSEDPYPEMTEPEVAFTPDCAGAGYYEYPTLCDGGERMIQEMLDGTGPYEGLLTPLTDSELSNSGSGCTWVSGYTRKNGTRVSGYSRCG